MHTHDTFINGLTHKYINNMIFIQNDIYTVYYVPRPNTTNKWKTKKMIKHVKTKLTHENIRIHMIIMMIIVLLRLKL